jgi:phage shock protein B
MNDNEAVISALAILMPVFIVLAVRLTRRGDSGPRTGDQAAMQALMQTAQRMERRIESLEMLLDTEVPGWRSRSTQG